MKKENKYIYIQYISLNTHLASDVYGSKNWQMFQNGHVGVWAPLADCPLFVFVEFLAFLKASRRYLHFILIVSPT